MINVKELDDAVWKKVNELYPHKVKEYGYSIYHPYNKKRFNMREMAVYNELEDLLTLESIDQIKTWDNNRHGITKEEMEEFLEIVKEVRDSIKMLSK